MHKVFIYVISALILFFPNKIKAFEGKTAKNFMGLYELKQGILAHDRGWFEQIEKVLALIIILN